MIQNNTTKKNILSDIDILEFQDNTLLEVTITDTIFNSDNIVHHHDLPVLPYSEYIKLHYCPPSAGFYIFGSKFTSEEEEMIINALLSSAENRDYL